MQEDAKRKGTDNLTMAQIDSRGHCQQSGKKKTN
jgi:hypothetical protein